MNYVYFLAQRVGMATTQKSVLRICNSADILADRTYCNLKSDSQLMASNELNFQQFYSQLQLN